MSFLEKNGGDPILAASLLEAPRFLTGLSDAELTLVRTKIEQATLTPEIIEAKGAVSKALTEAERGWLRSQELIAQDAGLTKNADGTWGQPTSAKVDADAA